MANKNIHTYIGIFLIVIGLLPFLGIGFGLLTTIVHILTIVSGIVIILTK
jgi:hypothetical protein